MAYVFHPESWYCGLYENFERQALRCLEAWVQEAQWSGVSVAATHLRVGCPEEAIVAVGEEVGAGLIVMDSKGRGRVHRALMGSVCDSVVGQAHRPVLVVRE